MTEIFNRSEQKAQRRGLRKQMPPAEVALWQRLRAGQLGGLKFRRQYGVGSYILDFYCPALRLAIELDGDTHYVTAEAMLRDQARQAFIERFGIRFLRFTNIEAQDNLDGVVERIRQEAARLSNLKRG